MRIHVGAGHVGYDPARALSAKLAESGHEVVWHGAASLDDGDDYPLFAVAVAQAVVIDEDRGAEVRGLLLGQGPGEAVAAGKVNGARPVLAADPELAELARRTTDANVLAVPLAFAGDLAAVVTSFLSTDFSAELDDARRLLNIAEYENSGTIEGWLIER